ncbi:UPF0057-domain-containing protein [Anaeromyces robustus]|uniref:UPF0057-domain-containing protein n=1 Tax=Anaeromyces robustus TaxID=1754192 RepID=A0A1Y1XG88_9FUNG|nr:UPF0057-domain-containing protein [Anaeromyces robustus]|eukprot:ORX84771.1 UPF0057-domain-containing protein [Anaeromyces robustus]
MANLSAVDMIKILTCFILPPLAVYFDRGFDCSFFLNLVLTFLGYLPGVIHALFVVCK